ncbi:MFS transporter [uncultured Intestinimonas sp.]|uniref:MFS transporter n=1 Tax=uncultured Intestinimonas sp. TaxID=1689265 RepID=UPI0025D55014|nr:MFS transporter [uncultured Intestinimonas sp.]
MTQNKSSTHAWMALIAMCLMCATWTGVTGNTISLFADPVVNELGITRTQYMLGSSTITGITNGLISMFLFGKIYAKIGIKKMMLIGGLIGTLGFASFAMAQNFAMILLGGILFGAGCCFNFTSTLAIVIDSWFKKKNGTYMSLAQTVGSVVGIICSTLYAILIAQVGWRAGFLTTVVICLITTFVLQILFKGESKDLGEAPMYADEASADQGQGQSAAEDGISFQQSLRTPRYYLLLVLIVLICILAYGPFGNLVLIASDLGYGAISGTLLSVALIASAVSLTFCGVIIDKFGTKWMISLALVLVAAALAIYWLRLDSTVTMYVSALMLGVGYNACILPGSIATRELLGSRDYGKKVAVSGAASLVGIALGPSVMSAFYDLTGSYDLGYVVCFIGCIICIIAIFPLTRRVKGNG